MKKSKPCQKTLFNSWGNLKPSTSKERKTIEGDRRCNETCDGIGFNPDDVIQLDEEDEDDDLLAAVAEMDTLAEQQTAGRDFDNNVCSGEIEHLPGFDLESGNVWIYPTNYPVRNYQYNIVEKALYKNTLVTLPTGLGKTFIAAVIMYNFYRWYPQGKVIFMAPTKPLVAQQIEACYNIMGIPQSDTVEMTGKESEKSNQ